MKTKHILTALALPTMFAACTADDIVSENNAMQQAERAKLSKDFVLNVNNGVESRYAVEGSTSLKFNFEEGDLIGANLIDAYEKSPNASKFDPKDPATWKIVNYVAPALPFENVGGDQWKSAGQLGIGNYIFTNPYNPEDKNRAAAKYAMPIVVKYSSKTPNAHIEDYNKAVAATILREDDTEATIALKNIYTYPKVRINFDKADEVTKVTKVVLEKDGGFICQGAFNHQDIANMFNAKTIEAWLENPANEGKTEADYWAEKQTANFVVDTEDEIDAYENFAKIETTPYFIYEMDEKVSANSIEVRLMMPSIESLLNADEDEIKMYVCTDKGNYVFNFTDVTSYSWKATTLAAQKDKALWRNKSNTLNVKAEALNDAGDVNFGSNIVSTAADWNALVAEYGDLKKYSAAYKEEVGIGETEGQDGKELIVKIIGDQFALTSDLKMPEVAEFIIESDVEVEGDVTLKNILVRKATDAEENPVLTVKKGATLTTDQTLNAPVVVVEEGAELVFAAAKNEKKELIAYTGISEVSNYGTVTVPAGVEASFYLNNAKSTSKFYVGSAAARSAVAVANILNKEVSATNIQASENNGAIYNYGELNVKGTLLNKAATEAAGYVIDKLTNKFTAQPSVLNEGAFNVEGAVYNYSEFANNDALSSNFNGDSEFVNAGTLTIGENASTYIDDNTNGTIVLAKLNPANFTIHDAKAKSAYGTAAHGLVKYTLTKAEQADVKLGTSPVTYLIANGDVKVSEVYNYLDDDSKPEVIALNTLEINGGAIEVSKAKNAATTPAYKAQITNLVVNSGKATIGGEIETVVNIEVKANAYLTILESAKVTLSGNYTFGAKGEDDKDAVMEVQGKLHMSAYTTSSGNYATTSNTNLKLGKNASVTCNKTATTEVFALESMVEAYWECVKTYGYSNSVRDGLVSSNPYDYNNFAAAITFFKSNWYTGTQTYQVAFKNAYDALMGTNGWNLASDKQTTAAFVKKIEADYANFASYVTTHIIGTATDAEKTALKNKFIDATTGAIKASYVDEDEFTQSATLYLKKDIAIRELTNALMYIDNGYDTLNETQFEAAKKIYLIISDIYTALTKTTYGDNQNGACMYIWKESTCPLYNVMATAKAYSPADWALAWGQTSAELFGTANAVWGTANAVNNWVKYASLIGATTEKTLAAGYYPASEAWDYTVAQIAACMDVEVSTITATAGGNN